jgi:hypothetical protein
MERGEGGSYTTCQLEGTEGRGGGCRKDGELPQPQVTVCTCHLHTGEQETGDMAGWPRCVLLRWLERRFGTSSSQGCAQGIHVCIEVGGLGWGCCRPHLSMLQLLCTACHGTCTSALFVGHRCQLPC